MYAFMASDSGCERGNTLPLVGVAPGSRSMAQSLDRWGGSWEALDLLNASERSWYSAERSDMTGISNDEGDSGVVAWGLSCMHSLWQWSDHCWICLLVQEIRGLCFSSQGSPRMTGFCGESMAKKRMDSMWREPTFRMRSWVVNLFRPVPNGRPSSAATASRDSHERRGSSWRLANLMSMKLPRCPRVD